MYKLIIDNQKKTITLLKPWADEMIEAKEYHFTDLKDQSRIYFIILDMLNEFDVEFEEVSL